MRSPVPWRYAVGRILLLLLIPVFFSCGDDGGDGIGPGIPSVAGSWVYDATQSLSGGGGVCNVGTTMTVTQSGDTFTGTYSGGKLTCFFGPQNTLVRDVNFESGTVVNGSVTTAGAVSFDFDTEFDWQNSGTLSGNSISGTATLVADFGEEFGVITVAGNFSASRQ